MKKTLAILLLLCFALGLLPGAALAEEEAERSEFVVQSREDLEKLAELCVLDTASRGLEVLLAADLDLEGREFAPIPLFAGHFDGQGHTIRGLKITRAASVTGLFRQLLPGALVENLSVSGKVTPSGTAEQVGGLCGWNGGTLRSCSFAGTVAGSRSVGGLCGAVGPEGLAEKSTMEGSVSGLHQVGGIAGEVRGALRGCLNRAAVNTEQTSASFPAEASLGLDLSLSAEEILDITDVGGIAGLSTGTLADCENLGEVGHLHVGYNVGGVAGRLSGAAENCRNGGPVSGRKDVGGILGQLEPEAGWSFSEGRLAELEGRLAELKRRVDRLVSDTGAEASRLSDNVSGLLSDLTKALEGTSEAAEALAGEAVDWLDDNLEEINAFTARLGEKGDELTRGIADVGEALEEFTRQLPGVTESLEAAFGALSEAASLAGDGMEEARKAVEAGQSGLEGLRDAGEKLREGLAQLRSGLGEPWVLRSALEQIAEGLLGLSQAWGRAEEALRALAAWTQSLTLPTREEVLEGAKEAASAAGEFLEEAAEEAVEAAVSALETGKRIIWDGETYRIEEDVIPSLQSAWDTVRGEWNALKEALIAYAARLRDGVAAREAAAADLAGDLRLLGEGSSRLLEAPNVYELRGFLTGTENAFASLSGTMKSWIAAGEELRATLGSFGDAGDEVSRAASLTGEAAEKLGSSLEAFHRAVEGLHSLAKSFSWELELSLTSLPRKSEARDALFASLREANDALNGLSDWPESGLQEDVQAVSEGIAAVTGLLMDALRGEERQGLEVEDISAEAASASAGTVLESRNRSPVTGETNVGGIVGAVTFDLGLDLDREDGPELSSFLSGSASYRIHARLSDCENEADVTALRSAAGGVAGRMDYGAAESCRSAGAVTAAGDYAGGIAGYSAGTLKGCFARSHLSGGNYVGGIAGFGHDLEDCISLPSFVQTAEFQGSVAGDADGVVSGNKYSGSSVGGVNGFSFETQALPVSYEELRVLSGEAPLFETVTVTFLREGETVAEVRVPYGGALETLPQVEDRDGQRWRWDPFPRESVKRSLTVEGHYVSPITSLSSGEPLPLFLAEGRFYEEMRLRVTPLALDSGEEARVLSVEGYDGPLTVRMREQREGELFLITPEGERPLETLRDGSYLVFEAENGSALLFREREERKVSGKLLWGGAAALVPALLLLVLLLRRRRKRKSEPADLP
ncbi:MAG: hypothetical protein IKO91_04610 [Oscillospiraceae bacterium]|nr:hypothetical protein [Oscillospiraceae bacterium]